MRISLTRMVMRSERRPAAPTPRLNAALAALVLFGAILAGGSAYARWLEYRYLRALAPTRLNQKNQGVALQQAAFDRPDMLPLYASSELIVGRKYQHPYYAGVLFQKAPTGFSVLPIGTNNTTCLIILQKLAAIGPDLRGKKVVISLSPGAFFNHRMVEKGSYAGNFSRLHAGELAFSTDLNFDLKQAAAKRMLEYPRTLRHDPLLRFALKRLADGSPLSRVLYYAALPLGKLQNLVLRLQDHWELIRFIWTHPQYRPDLPAREQPLNWEVTLSHATTVYEQHNQTNPFGFDDTLWQKYLGRETSRSHNSLSDKAFLAHLRKGKEWIDLDLLLRELKDLGAQPLILSMPISERFYEYLGVSSRAQAAYYTKLRAAIQPYGFALRDFAEHDQDKDFLLDTNNHLSALGWAYYDQTIDAFYHGTLR
jgi:D-alanine transfer protein